ncbi:MAG TPA: hypothetical protein VE931_07525 [Pyrinomonadaceae bacterium]|nr:hypothetical protein [Pyrinomonadaceae bacterium]
MNGPARDHGLAEIYVRGCSGTIVSSCLKNRATFFAKASRRITIKNRLLVTNAAMTAPATSPEFWYSYRWYGPALSQKPEIILGHSQYRER